MIKFIDCPRTLFIDAEAAKNGQPYPEMTPERMRMIAERWQADQEKIAYLESLIVRIGRRD